MAATVLPFEVWAQIGEYIPIDDLRQNFAAVNQSLRDVSRSNLLWEHLLRRDARESSLHIALLVTNTEFPREEGKFHHLPEGYLLKQYEILQFLETCPRLLQYVKEWRGSSTWWWEQCFFALSEWIDGWRRTSRRKERIAISLQKEFPLLYDANSRNEDIKEETTQMIRKKRVRLSKKGLSSKEDSESDAEEKKTKQKLNELAIAKQEAERCQRFHPSPQRIIAFQRALVRPLLVPTSILQSSLQLAGSVGFSLLGLLGTIAPFQVDTSLFKLLELAGYRPRWVQWIVQRSASLAEWMKSHPFSLKGMKDFFPFLSLSTTSMAPPTAATKPWTWLTVAGLVVKNYVTSSLVQPLTGIMKSLLFTSSMSSNYNQQHRFSFSPYFRALAALTTACHMIRWCQHPQQDRLTFQYSFVHSPFWQFPKNFLLSIGLTLIANSWMIVLPRIYGYSLRIFFGISAIAGSCLAVVSLIRAFSDLYIKKLSPFTAGNTFDFIQTAALTVMVGNVFPVTKTLAVVMRFLLARLVQPSKLMFTVIDIDDNSGGVDFNGHQSFLASQLIRIGVFSLLRGISSFFPEFYPSGNWEASPSQHRGFTVLDVNSAKILSAPTPKRRWEELIHHYYPTRTMLTTQYQRLSYLTFCHEVCLSLMDLVMTIQYQSPWAGCAARMLVEVSESCFNWIAGSLEHYWVSFAVGKRSQTLKQQQRDEVSLKELLDGVSEAHFWASDKVIEGLIEKKIIT